MLFDRRFLTSLPETRFSKKNFPASPGGLRGSLNFHTDFPTIAVSLFMHFFSPSKCLCYQAQ